jgi:hypothetical protein
VLAITLELDADREIVAPACHARWSVSTNCTISPRRRTRKCAETRKPASSANAGCDRGSRVAVNSRSIASPEKRPGGRLM